MKDTLIKAGFVINHGKSVWEPTKIITWLGVTIDTKNHILYVSEKRIKKCELYILYLLSSPYTTARTLARFIGMIISMKFVMGPIVNLKTRFCNHLVITRVKWDRPIKLFENNAAIKEIFFWKDNLSALNVKPFQLDDRCNNVTVHSEASEMH